MTKLIVCKDNANANSLFQITAKICTFGGEAQGSTHSRIVTATMLSMYSNVPTFTGNPNDTKKSKQIPQNVGLHELFSAKAVTASKDLDQDTVLRLFTTDGNLRMYQ